MDIKALEAKYGKRNLRLATVKTEDGDQYEFVLRKPTRSIIKAVNASKGDEEKAEKIMASNCIVGGPMEALEDGEVYLGIIEQVGKLFKKASVDVKKL
ncbi:hypothetical protein LS482_16190 [Sinomicrobium kalidii]|uniref:hypothetical protein n=1 Tax=Sinomicrobium kalidii TaxID=2900738 RepID=UPI001E4D7A0B|nr:hypothetical protein [Sinomicrobium kalidii]UGU15213.1 hypothetical protein LS482_16190 [Sinomicrobium kalidii]